MMDFYEDERFFYEPSEFEEKCSELINMLRQHATKEIKDELERLRAENASMQDIVNNYEKKVKELEDAKRNYQWNQNRMEAEITQKVKAMRLSEILSDFSTTLYCVKNIGKEKPKCDKCDKNGYIHYKSPQGYDRQEQCDCQGRTPYYEVKESRCVEFRISTKHDAMRGKLVGFYKEESDDYYSLSNYGPTHIYKGQDFSQLDEYYALFYDEETAQKYADWLNERSKT